MTRKSSGSRETLPVLGAKALVWDLSGQASAQIMHLLIRLILARLLLPEDFGLVAIAMLVISFSWWFIDLGFGSFLVQCKDLSESHKSTAFWSNGVLAVLLCFATVAAAPLLAAFFSSPELTAIVIALSLRNILSFPESTLTALFQKELDFKPIALRKLLATVIGGSCGIVAALSGFGVWALVVDSLVRAGVGSLLLTLQSSWKPKLIFDQPRFLEMWHYSRHLLVARFTSYVSRNLDTVVIGRFMGPHSLGVYGIAYQFVLFPLTYFSRSVNNVLFSMIAKIIEDTVMVSHLFVRSSRCVAVVVFPPMFIIALYSEPLVRLVLGGQWSDAATLVPYMCGVGCIQALYALFGSLYQAKARTREFSRFVLVNAIVVGLALILGVNYGILGIARAYLFASLIVFPFQIGRALISMHVNLKAYAVGVLWALALSAIVVSPVLLSGLVDVKFGVASGLSLLLSAILYGLLILFATRQLMELRSSL